MRATRLLASLLTAAALFAGCGDNYGDPCNLPRMVEENCASGSSDTHINCVMTDNLECGSKICAVYQDSSPYCTLDCAADADCPAGNVCVPFFLDDETDRFCVAKDLASSAAAPDGS